jgi:hypothetical protein
MTVSKGLMSSSAALYRDMAEHRFQLAALEYTAGPLDPRAAVLREQIGRLRVRAGLVDAQLAARIIEAAGQSAPQEPTASDWFAQIQSHARGSRAHRVLAGSGRRLRVGGDGLEYHVGAAGRRAR